MWRRHRYRSAQRDDLDTLQHESDPMARLLAGERLVESVTADRNRALVAACTEYGRTAVAEALGITRQAVYKRLQGAAVGQLVRTPRHGDRRSRIRALMPAGTIVGEENSDGDAAVDAERETELAGNTAHGDD